MGFRNPLLLSGLAFLAVPILLLLFLHQRRRVIHWAAYEWMRKSIVQQKRRIQIHDLLKLLAKLFLIAALVLMVARPFLHREGLGDRAAAVIDNSPSMATRYESGQRLDRAKETVQNMLARYDGNLAVYTFSNQFEGVVSDFSSNKAGIRRAVDSIQLAADAAGADTFFSELKRNSTLLNAQTICFVGDFQAKWYSNGQKIATEMQSFGEGLPMLWHSVDTRPNVLNAAVTRLSLSPEGAFYGRNCFLSVTLLNGVDRPQPERILQIYVDGLRKRRVPVKLGPSEERRLTFVFSVDEPGWHNIVAELDADELAIDNRRFAALYLKPKLNVLLAAPENKTSPIAFDKYVDAALASLFEKGVKVTRRKPSLITPDEIAVNDIVITVNAPLNDDVTYSRALHDYVAAGGRLIAFLPGESADEAAVFDVDAEVGGGETRIDAAQLRDSYLAFMQDSNMNPRKITFDRSLVFNPDSPARTRLTTEAGPVGLALERGKGRLALFGFTPYQGRTTFVFNPNFLQFLLRAISDVSNTNPLHKVVGRFEEWTLPGLEPTENYVLKDRRGNSWELTVRGIGETPYLVMPSNLPPGIYGVHNDRDELARAGLNPDTEDSRLQPIREQDLRQPIREGLTFSSGDQIAKADRRLDLLLYAAILLLAAVAFEAYAHFFRRIA